MNKSFLFLFLFIIIFYIWNNIDHIYYSLSNNGYIILPNVMNNNECDNLLEIIDDIKMKGTIKGNINSQHNREDLMLPLDDVKEYIKKIYNKTKHYWIPILGDDAIICECSSLISYTGAYPQIWHTDTHYTKGDSKLISIGIALKDITEDMGPLHVFEKSNNLYEKDKSKLIKQNNIITEDCDYDERGLCSQRLYNLCKKLNYKQKSCIAKKGDLVAWMSSIVHRGSGNISDNSRPVFYFSLMSKNGNPPDGSTYSLLTDKVSITSL